MDINTLLYSGALMLWSGVLILAEGHWQATTEQQLSTPLLVHEAFVPLDGVWLVDWTNLGNSTGLSSLVDQAFAETSGLLLMDGFDIFSFWGGGSSLAIPIENVHLNADGLPLWIS